QRFKSLAMSVHHPTNARIERHTAKVLEPCHTHTFEVAIERSREAFSGFVDGKGSARIGPRNRTQCESKIGCGASQTSGSAESGPCERRLRIGHAADRSPKSDDVAKSCGIAQRSARVGTAGNGRLSARQSYGSST